MARRRNAVFHRLSRLKGLPPDEKMLLQRIGNLLDAALNNRQASNPYEPARNKRHRAVYPPTGLLTATGFQSATITWTAPASNEHLRYEVTIQNNDTGATETKTTYTNYLKYKGANGSYTAKVRTVGRDGSTSTTETVDFTLGGNVMQIEGSKNGPTELGTMVQDDIVLYPGYSIFAWGHAVLDKYAAGSSNEQMVFKLWSMPGASQVFDADTATLVETITLYPASETASNLDSSARAGLISRPAGTRSGSFETSQSVMFSPISVSEDEENLTYTFFLQAVNRETEQDEVNLSLVLWGGFAGLGDSIPQDPWDGGRTPYVFPHLNSVRFYRQGSGIGSYFCKRTESEYNIIDNTWTVAIWFRPETTNAQNIFNNPDTLASTNVLFDRSYYDSTSPYVFNQNRILITYSFSTDTIDNFHNIQCFVYGKNGTGTANASFVGKEFNDFASFNLATTAPTWGRRNYGWTFLVCCFEGGESTSGDLSTTPKIRMYISNRRYSSPTPYVAVPFNSSESGDPWWHNDGMECLGQKAAIGAPSNAGSFAVSQSGPANARNQCYTDVSDDYNYALGCLSQTMFASGQWNGSEVAGANNGCFLLHQIGMWNVAIDNWDGIHYNPGIGDTRDTSPSWDLATGENGTALRYGRENDVEGSSMTAIHYLYNQGYGTDIDWLKNSNQRPDGAYEYIFAENLVHLWQFGAVPQQFAVDSETMRDTGRFMYGGEVNFCNDMPAPIRSGRDSQSWWLQADLPDIYTPVRWTVGVGDPTAALDADQANVPQGNGTPWGPGPWGDSSLPNYTDQDGLLDPDNGTTTSLLAYPGLGLRAQHGAASTDETVIENNTLDWRRPWTINGVLVEPKQWGINGYTSMPSIPGYS